MDSFYDYLKNRLAKELPGQAIQLEMAPKPNNGRISRMPDIDDVRVSAVLILLHRIKPSIYNLLFTLRSESLSTHKGQISFPGGQVCRDETIVHAALRETKEEVGIEPDSVHILGQITGLYIPNSKSYIHPVVGYVNQNPDMKLNTDEVQEAFFISMDQLLDRKNLKTTERILHDKPYKIPYWDIHETTPLWGATAMIVNEFVTVYREFTNIDSLPDI